MSPQYRALSWERPGCSMAETRSIGTDPKRHKKSFALIRHSKEFRRLPYKAGQVLPMLRDTQTKATSFGILGISPVIHRLSILL